MSLSVLFSRMPRIQGRVHHIGMSLQTISLPVKGMTCGGCVRSVERKLMAIPGVSKSQVDLAGASATVEFDASRVKVSDLVSAIEQLGYQVPSQPQQ